jgi:flavorubredoxin
MSTEVVLHDDGVHRNVLLDVFDRGLAVESNQHLIIHGNEGLILDPGGHKIYNRVITATLGHLGGGTLRYIFLSHQDPDVVAATNGWLMTTDAEAYCSALWQRFIPHFGVDRLVEQRLKAIPDEGMTLHLGGAPLTIVPAHFLHSPGNFQIYDPTSRILYSGDLGASVGAPSRVVEDFDAHAQLMLGFHRRYMSGTRALKLWLDLVRQLDIQTIAPQHGAMFVGREMVERFLAWCDQLEVGVDLLTPYRLPPGAP